MLTASVKIESNAVAVNPAASAITFEGLAGITVIVDKNFSDLKNLNSLAEVF